MTDLPIIKILDCTLRDGGHVNDFNFGRSRMRSLVSSLSRAGVDIVELGFLKNVAYDPDKSLFSDISQAEALIEDLPVGLGYSLMIRPDWFDIDKLAPCQGRIQKLRWAFHYRDIELTIHQASRARALGYEIHLNPVNVFSYSPGSLLEMLEVVNGLRPAGVAIVDTHGSMIEEDLVRFHKIFDDCLSPEISLSLHLHENLSLSFSLAQKFIQLNRGRRNIGIDASVLGMGRAPGNLCTELITRYVNLHFQGHYDLAAIYEAIDEPISDIKRHFSWGYEPLYAETAFYKMHRSYAEYLIDKTSLSYTDASKVLSLISVTDYKEEFSQSVVEAQVERFERQHTEKFTCQN